MKGVQSDDMKKRRMILAVIEVRTATPHKTDHTAGARHGDYDPLMNVEVSTQRQNFPPPRFRLRIVR